MGCGGSKNSAKGGGAAGAPKSSGGKGGDNAQLLSEYTLGEVLGQGAFGVVYACTRKGQKDFSFAVKMVDKVETPVAEIQKEADMLKMLEHPNVVKFHSVYFEKVFVCIVMDRYNGGDLIEGMQLHWKTKGKIPCTKVIHISRQMAAAIKHLHSKNVVHRDIKGDNYLTDRKDITDPQCRVIMSDFGTAEQLKAPADRLKSSCGTKIYWPPEFYQGNYGLKVDVWALGVIMYGLLDGRFPFKGEQEVRIKPVRLPSSAPQKCQDFVLHLLEKDENKRYNASQACLHPWINDGSVDTSGGTDLPHEEGWQAEGMREGGGNAGQDERRKELIDRMENAAENAEGAAQKKQEMQHQVLWGPRFDVSDRRTGKALRYEWWSLQRMKEKKVVDLDSAVQMGNDVGQVDPQTVGKMLEEHGIDTNKFGQGEFKTLKEFATEVHIGAASLMLDATKLKTLVRVVDVVLLRIRCQGKILTEFEEKFSDGRTRSNLNRLPGTKKEPHENTKKTTDRIVNELLGLDSSKVVMDLAGKEVFEEEEESRSFPGVMTVYRKEIVPIEITDPGMVAKVGISGAGYSNTDANKNTKSYRWLTNSECAKAVPPVKMDAKGDGEEVSGLVQAPVGYGEDELRQFLEANKVDTSAFGANHAKTLKEFSNELIKGESSLMVDASGKVVRVVDVVLLLLAKEGVGEILVETQEKYGAGDAKTLNRLPGTKRRPDENHFVTAQRVLKRQLKMDENVVNLNKEDVKVIEEQKDSPSFPGVSSMYRKRIISAVLLKPADQQ